MNLLRLITLATLCFSLFLGCSRSLDSNKSYLTLQAPKNFLKNQKGSRALAAPDLLPNRKECWGVNILGEGMPSTTGPLCGPQTLGKFVGYLDSNQTINVDVEKGSDRTIQLFLFLAAEGVTECPEWNTDFNSKGDDVYSRTYVVDTVTGVDMSNDTTDVVMTPVFSDILATVGKSSGDANCSPPGGTLQATLFSSGDIFQGDLVTPIPSKSHPTAGAVINTFASEAFTGHASHGAYLEFQSVSVQGPEHLASVTRKPDGGGEFYGLLHDGSVVSVDGSTGAITTFNTTNCPLNTCQVPVWMESISVGLGKNIYAKDHGGNVYKFAEDGSLQDLGIDLPLYVSHFSFY